MTPPSTEGKQALAAGPGPWSSLGSGPDSGGDARLAGWGEYACPLPLSLLAARARCAALEAADPGGSQPEGRQVPSAGTGPAWRDASPPSSVPVPDPTEGQPYSAMDTALPSLATGATGAQGVESVPAACQGLCVPSFYGVPRAPPVP